MALPSSGDFGAALQRGNGDMESGGGEWRAGGQPTAGVAVLKTACGAGAGGGREY